MQRVQTVEPSIVRLSRGICSLDRHGCSLRCYSTNGKSKTSDKPQERDRFVEEIEAGVDTATKGRIIPEERKKDRSWMELVEQMKRPDRNVLLPLEREIRGASRTKKQPRQNKEKPSDANKNVTVSGAFRDVIDGFKLVVQLTTGRAKFNWDKKPEALDREKDPIERALALESWEDFDEELEATLTRMHNLKSGEELVILGSGISGLSLAWFVANARPDIKITVLEKTDRVGGYMNSSTATSGDGIKNTVFESGPRTLLPSHPGTKIALQLINELGMIDKLGGIGKREPANTKAMAFDGELVKFPNSGTEALTFMNSPIMSGIKFAVLKDFLISRARKSEVRDESVESFISRRFNAKIADRFVSSMMRGIYAGDIAELSARSVARLNKLYMLERTKKTSVFGAMFTGIMSAVDDYSKQALPLLSQAIIGKTDSNKYSKALSRQSMVAFDGGIGQFASRMAEMLKRDYNVDIQLNRAVEAIKPADGGCEIKLGETSLHPAGVISTLPAKDVAPLLTASHEAQEMVSQIKFTTMAVVNMFFPDKKITPEWFGFLIPKSEKSNGDVLGVIFDSAVRNSTVPIENCVVPQDNPKKEEFKPFQLPEKKDPETREPMSVERVKNFFIEQLTDEPIQNPNSQSANNPNSNSTTLTVMMGGHLWDNKAKLPSDQEILDSAVATLKHYLPDAKGVITDDFIHKITIQHQCIPQPTVGHTDRVDKIHQAVADSYNNRLFLSGTSFGRGVGVGDCLVDSLTIASRFSEQRKLLYPQFYINHYMAATYPSLYA